MKGKPFLNFRPVLFGAVALALGIFFYGKCRFGGLTFSDFLFPVLFLCLAAFPLGRKRLLALALTLLLFAGTGVLGMHLYSENYLSAPGGEFMVSGRVVSVSAGRGYSVAVLDRLSLDGERTGGKLRVTLSGNGVSPADLIEGRAEVEPIPAGEEGSDYCFASDIRATARLSSYEKKGTSSDPFLLLNGALFKTLFSHLPRDEASLAFAMLTGNSGMMDEGVSDAVQRGGIAHIFAVSGLHIGILYGAVYLLAKPLKKWRFAPALAVAFAWSAVCAFSVSSVRAVIMCGALSLAKLFGRKYDFLESLGLAGVLVLLIFPAQFFAAGMRLSFGACLGLGLFSGSFSRLFSRLHFPRFLGGYLSAAFSVFLFTLPVSFLCFGYLSVWQLLLNFFLIPALPALFLCALVCSFAALAVSPAAAFFLIFPKGIFAALLFLFAATDFSFVISGFALGAGGAVWLCGCLVLSPRVRMRASLRGIASFAFALLFTVAVLLENAVFSGLRADVTAVWGRAVLLRTDREAVLILDGERSVRQCEDFLRRTYGGKIDLIVTVGEPMRAINVAAFLGAEEIAAREEVETGLKETDVRFGERFTCGSLSFEYVSAEAVAVTWEGNTLLVDFGEEGAEGYDFSLDLTRGGLKYFIKDGKMTVR